jgi:site-specific DNA-methyltransferase (adenine-specific)
MSLSQSNLNWVITGDCLKLLPLLPAASVDMVLTDPPYLVRYHSRDGRGVPNDDTDAWLMPAFGELYRVLKPDRFCVSFCGFTQAEKFLLAWKGAGFRVLEHLVWRKRYPSSTGFVRRYHEQAYLLAKGTPRRPHMQLSSVLEWRYTENRLHPTQKPVGALLPLVMAFSQIGDVILDPFAGSGSSAVAAALLGRHYLAFELDEEYARLARARLQTANFRTM